MPNGHRNGILVRHTHRSFSTFNKKPDRMTYRFAARNATLPLPSPSSSHQLTRRRTQTLSGRERIVKFRLSLKTNCAPAIIALALACLAATHAAASLPAAGSPVARRAFHADEAETLSPSAQSTGHLIKLDNTQGMETLTLSEHLRERQCVAAVTPDFVVLPPGETANVRLAFGDNLRSGCQDEPKHVVWNITSTQAAGRTLSYMMLYSLDPQMEMHGRTRIALNTRFARPGTPYAAICGAHACLDEWVPADESNSTIFFYPRN